MRKSAVMTFAVLCAAVPWVGAQDDVLETFDRFLTETDSYAARFTQYSFDENLELLEQTEGRMYFKRPGGFRMDQTEPYPQTIVTDGSVLWFYEADLGQATRNRLDTDAGASPALLLGGGIDVEDVYDVSALPDGRGMQWVGLTPRAEDGQYDEIRVGFRDGELAGLRYSDLLRITVLEFEDAESNVPLDDAMFDFEPPPGVDVVDAVSQ